MRQTEHSRRAAAPTSRSFGDVLAAGGGVGRGFPFLRIFVALSIVLSHSEQTVTGIDWSYDHPFWLLVYLQVPAFLTMSGFLTAASGSRLRVADFLVHRALRIYPALMTEIVLSIFLVGLVFTTLPLGEFFAREDLYLYLTNLVGLPHYHLPGVFETNPLAAKVNGSLWTVPYELMCYAIMAAFMATGALRDGRKLLVAAVVVTLLAVRPEIWYMVTGLWRAREAHPLVKYLCDNLLRPSSLMAFAYFCWGACCYRFRDRIPYRRSWFFAGAAVMVLMSLFAKPHMDDVAFKLALLPVAEYMFLFIGLTAIPLPKFLRGGDYSYGIYLYGFPIQQAVESLTRTQASVLLNFALSMPIIFLWSKFSWAVIEKPALGLKARLAFSPAAARPEAAPAPEALRAV